MAQNYQIISINEDSYCIDEGGVRCFVLVGKEKALLIDTGMNLESAKAVAESITSLPVELLNTHADMDHTGSNKDFAAPYMSLSELSNYHSGGNKGEVTPVWDGDVLDLGDRPLEIIALPGHTPGSIAVLDVKHRNLYSGDPIQDGQIYMFGVQRNLCAYRHSLLRLKTMTSRFDNIYPSHATMPVSPALIDQLIEGAEQIMAGTAEGKMGDVWGNPVKIYDMGYTTFLCNAD